MTTPMKVTTMTKAHHPARRARNLTGAASALALVAMVTGFQFAAAAESHNALLAKSATPSPGQTGTSAEGATTNSPTVDPSAQTVTANVTSVTQSQTTDAVVDPCAAPAPVVNPSQAPAPEGHPAPPAPAPAPAPPSGTTAAS
jgi:hypothetical protein